MALRPRQAGWAQIWAHPCGNALLVTVISESTSSFESGASPWDKGHVPNATITVDAALKERLAALASQSGQRVDEFVEALLRWIANADVDSIAAFRSFHDGLALQR